MLEREESAVLPRVVRKVGWNPPRHRGRVCPKRELWLTIQSRVDRFLTIRYLPSCGWLLVAVRDAAWRGRLIAEYPHWEVNEMKKRTPALHNPESSAQNLAAMESNLFSKLFAIVKQCAVTRYDDGDARNPGSLFVSTQGSMWRVTVTEPDSCLKLTMMAQTLDDALAGLCLALESESIPWEIDAYAMSRKPKKKN